MKKMSSGLLSRLAAAGFLCLVVGLARAQSDVPPEADPPDRAARLSFVEGEVSLQPAGEEDWASAVLNRPLTTGDKLWTDKDARAEIQVGPAAVRLGSDTGFSFLNVDDDTIQMRVTAGIVNVRVRALDSNDHIEIDTPNLALSLLRPGNYRVEVNDAGDTTVVKVSEGEAEASGGSQDVVVHAQQSAVFRGTDQLAPPELASLGAPDGFDSWTLERDRLAQRAESSQTARYVAPEVTGYEDLDANGSWSSDPEYGYVWTPTTVAVGWAPYRYGRWVWISPWGWTWVDDAPWGFAPFHYGRWAYIRSRWCWVPGPRAVRPVYAPALVGWVGTPGVSVTIAVGGGAGVAWFPLGPREVYVPARRFSPRYVERVNVTNTVIVNRTYITNVYENRVTHITYRNRTVPGAVTAVSRTTFTSAQPVGRHTVRLTEREITRVQATAFAPRIEPVRESRLGTVRRNVRVPPATIVNRQVIVKREPPPAAARFARNAGERDAAREQADRLHRIQDRNEAVNRTRPNRNAVADERPRESTPRRDRPPATPDHIDRAGSDADRLQQERQARQDQRQREQDAQRRAQDLQQRQAQIQRDQEARQQQFQADRHVREERNDRDRADDQASQRAQLQARRQELQRQQESQRQDAQRQEMQRQLEARRQQDAQRQEMQRQQQAQREEMQRQLEARRQQDAQRQEMQRQQQAQREEMQRQLEARRQQDAQRQEMQRQQAARVAQREHANQPSRQQSPPPDRDRRRPDQSSREQ
jgi:hypothetical protein